MTSDPAKPFLTIRPPRGWTAVNFAELWQFRDLLLVLAGRDVKLRYRQTLLGIAWVLLQPLLAAGIFALVFGRIAKLPSDGVPYFIFSYAGLLGWTAFSSTLAKASISLVGNSHLVSKVYFPRMILPLSTVLSTLIDFAIALIVMFIMMAFYRIPLSPGIVLLPLWLLVTIMLAIGIGLFTAALTVSYRDVQYIMPVLIQFMLYASPVAYSMSVIPQQLRLLFIANPMTGLLEGFRFSLLGTGSMPWAAAAYSVVFTIIICVLGAMSFKRMERRFADVI